MAEYGRRSELRAFDDTKAGVKGLVDAGVAKIPGIFVHQEYMLEEKSPQPELSVPVIDLGCLDRGAIIQQLKDASRDWGFFKIVNHGIPTSLMDKVVEVVKEFNELLSEALGLNPNHLRDMNCAEGQFVAANYYPACPEPDKTLGFNSHTDSGFLTLLLQDQIEGLQILHKNQWVDVPPSPGALLVNIGDMMQLITNGEFTSVYHRVLAKREGPRVSVALVFRMHVEESSKSRVYGPMKELLSEENPPIYREAKAEEIVTRRYEKGMEKTPLLKHLELNTSSE